MSLRRFTAHPLVIRRLRVIRAANITPRMRRVTLGGEQLGEFEGHGIRHGAFSSPAFDDHVKLVFAEEGPVEAVLPVQLEHGIDWTAAAARVTRDYTPRAMRSGDAGGHGGCAPIEVDFDFVLHGDASAAELGPAERWASEARPGDDLWIVGPKSSTIVPDDADRVVLIGDETALPAIARFVEERPLDVPVCVVVTIASERAKQPLAVRDGDRVDWVVAAPGDATALEAAVRAVEAPAFDGTPYVWAAAESRALLPVRKYVARELGVPRTHIDITGYWHVRDHVAEVTDGDASGQADAAPRIQSPVAWLVVRGALQLGVLDALDREPVTNDALGERVAVPGERLAPIIDVLVARGVVVDRGGILELSEWAADLVADEHAREAYDGIDADETLALLEIAPALRAGDSAWSRRRGASQASEVAAGGADLRDELDERAGRIAYLLPALLAMPVWSNVGSVEAGGPGGGLVAEALRELDAGPGVILHREPDEAVGPPRPTAAPAPAVDLLVDVFALQHRTDDEARRHFVDRALRSSRLVVVESTHPDALNPNALDEAVIRLATTGAPPRPANRIAELAAEAGWGIDPAHPVAQIGWGVEVLVLRARAVRTASPASPGERSGA